MFEKEDLPLLKKLKVKTLLDLALLVPSSYKDTTLSKKIENNKTLIAKAKVINQNIINSRLQVTFFLEDFKSYISGIFFKTTPFHKKLFLVGSSHIIEGKVNIFNNKLQILQPKSLKSFGKIEPNYKKEIKESQIKHLISKYITKENLSKTPLNSSEIETILNLHFPSSLGDIKKDGELKEEVIKDLKSIEAINYILKLRRKRVFKEAKKALRADLAPFFKSLPFSLTNDQLKAIDDIKKDLSQDKKAARRVIIGDVGSGKTMVILASALIANKEKSILMAPTSILANQLFEEAQKYLGRFLDIALLTQKSQIGDYKRADFIIGTHALLYRDDLPKVALVMVDEQHRFGANQRAMLDFLNKEENKSPHFLQFSATPIPRTQAMIESESIDISIIKELPYEKKITTKIIQKKDFKELFLHIKKEIEKNHQVLIIYPLVEPSEEIPYSSLNEAIGFWERNFDGVFVTYGKDKDKDEKLLEFREKGNILLSTTVVEVGISLPRLTTIVIVGAERFGLATLHQLRGRVGRYGIDSYCFLYTNLASPPKRLIEFSKILDGFKIAELDLKYRNSGDLLDGTIQSGKTFKWLDLSEDEEIISEVKERLNK
ncbi:MAG: ATP-dependent DNA helicase RecG [Epsilonproteobacteria bacterium]|nr:ATP-dependent DNA helicase RecG [Campylobacterota bacterium]